MDSANAMGRMILGFAFISAALAKIHNPQAATRAVSSLFSRARMQSGIFVAALIVWELILGVAILIGLLNSTTLYVALITLLAFTAALIVLKRSGYDHACGCFGVVGSEIRGVEASIVRNCLFGTINVVLIFIEHVSPSAVMPIQQLDLALLLFGLITFAGILLITSLIIRVRSAV